jgi:hypothetical protein
MQYRQVLSLARDPNRGLKEGVHSKDATLYLSFAFVSVQICPFSAGENNGVSTELRDTVLYLDLHITSQDFETCRLHVQVEIHVS